MPTQTDIARALATPGGHLSIGEFGATLFYDNCRCSGFDGDEVKDMAIAAGLPVIDSRPIPFALRVPLVTRGPMVAVNKPPGELPWHGLSYAPLERVAAAYRRAGAEVHNIDEATMANDPLLPGPPASAEHAIKYWLLAIREEREGSPA